MKKFPKIKLLLITALWTLLPSPLSAHSLNGTIIRVIDGDSLLVNNKGIEENVRLIGIDAPEAHDNPKAEKDAERDSEALSKVLSRGKEAAVYVRGFVHSGDKVRVETDVQQRDPYGRLLGYVYLSNGVFLNEKIIKAGYAVPLCIEPNVKFRKKFEFGYDSAFKNKRGLWNQARTLKLPSEKLRGEKVRSEKKGKRKKTGSPPETQTEVTDQKEVSDLK